MRCDMGYSLDPVLADCYPDTAVLINKFDIKDEEKLSAIESVITTTRYAEWISNPLCNTFDFEHYKSIHRYLFSDLYEWAGKVRTVNIGKMGTHFTCAEQIDAHAELIFKRLIENRCFKDLQHDAFVENIIDFYCSTNALHPFREGNGRTQRAFITQLINNAGYSISFTDIDTDLLMIATVQAAHGVTDLLNDIFFKSINGRIPCALIAQGIILCIYREICGDAVYAKLSLSGCAAGPDVCAAGAALERYDIGSNDFDWAAAAKDNGLLPIGSEVSVFVNCAYPHGGGIVCRALAKLRLADAYLEVGTLTG